MSSDDYRDYQGYQQYVPYEQQQYDQGRYGRQPEPQYPASEYEDPGYSSYGSYGSQAAYGYGDASGDSYGYGYAQQYPQDAQGYPQQEYSQGFEQQGFAQQDYAPNFPHGYDTSGYESPEGGYGYGYAERDPLGQSQSSYDPPSQSQLSQSQSSYDSLSRSHSSYFAEPEAEPGDGAEPEPEQKIASRVEPRPEPKSAAKPKPQQPSKPKTQRQGAVKKRGRKGIGVIVALVIIGGAGAYVYSGNSSHNSAASGTSAGATTGSSSGAGMAGGSASVASPKSASPTPAAELTLPASIDGLTQMTNTTGKNVVQAMTKANSSSPDLASAQVAAYEKSGSSSFFADLTLVQLSKAPDFQTIYQSAGPDAALKSLGASSFTDMQIISTKIPGSAMACGLSSAGGVILRKCIWMDLSEYGLFAAVKTVGNSDAAAFAQAIEAASEAS